jgi:hypothetical protein
MEMSTDFGFLATPPFGQRIWYLSHRRVDVDAINFTFLTALSFKF